jgi:hypothetical protein
MEIGTNKKESYKLVICVFGCATIPEYKNEILKIDETWGNRAQQKGVIFFGRGTN